MKTKHHLPTASLALLLAFSLEPSALFAQGSLTPPGAPAPTMKTLAQIEPRTPISTAPFTISVPGSYYLTTNLTVATGNAVTIATSGVTLDLGGFTISSTAASATGYGIRLNSGLRNLSILNGFIQGGVTNDGSGTYNGPGFQSGIFYSGTAPVNARVAGVAVSGCLASGIYLGRGDSTVVESCTVRTVGSYGIYASTIKSSVAVDCGITAIYGDQVSDSRGESTGSGSGLSAITALNCYGLCSSGYGMVAFTVQNCYGSSSGGQYGLYVYYTAQNCYGHSDSSTGLYAYGTALNCYGSSSSDDGLYATTAQGSYGHSSGSGAGLSTTAALNCYGSSASGNGLYTYTAQNCRGESSGSGHGIFASETAQNCYGLSASGTGLSAQVAQNCVGWGNGTGLYAEQIAIGCFGHSSTSGKALRARIANSCHGYDTSAATSEDITYKYNMP